MKKFLVFITLLFLLILSEYFLISEFFFARRVPVLMVSLVATVFFIFISIRFFKKFLLHGKQTNAQS